MTNNKNKSELIDAMASDAEVVSFYKRQGWILEPRGSKCAFWYAN